MPITLQQKLAALPLERRARILAKASRLLAASLAQNRDNPDLP